MYVFILVFLMCVLCVCVCEWLFVMVRSHFFARTLHDHNRNPKPFFESNGVARLVLVGVFALDGGVNEKMSRNRPCE